MTTPDHRLIRCADHSYAPWGIVCRHIVEGTAKTAFAIPQTPPSEVEYDWICEECYKRHPDKHKIKDLRAVCCHCIKKVIEPYKERRAVSYRDDDTALE